MDNALRALYVSAARSLTRLDEIQVVERAPIVKDSWGHAYLQNGLAFIDLNPNQSPEQLFMTFLHECGHFVNNDVYDFQDVDLQMFPSAIVDFTVWTEAKDYQEYAERPEELAAESFAAQFNDFAAKKALDWFGDASIENRLRILAETSIQPFKPEEKR